MKQVTVHAKSVFGAMFPAFPFRFGRLGVAVDEELSASAASVILY